MFLRCTAYIGKHVSLSFQTDDKRTVKQIVDGEAWDLSIKIIRGFFVCNQFPMSRYCKSHKTYMKRGHGKHSEIKNSKLVKITKYMKMAMDKQWELMYKS